MLFAACGESLSYYQSASCFFASEAAGGKDFWGHREQCLAKGGDLANFDSLPEYEIVYNARK